jgi:hypothetical protein
MDMFRGLMKKMEENNAKLHNLLLTKGKAWMKQNFQKFYSSVALLLNKSVGCTQK